MISHKTSAALISWGGALLTLALLFVLFSAMGILTSTGRYSDTNTETLFFYLGIVLALGAVSLILAGVHRVVANLPSPVAAAVVSEQPVTDPLAG